MKGAFITSFFRRSKLSLRTHLLLLFICLGSIFLSVFFFSLYYFNLMELPQQQLGKTLEEYLERYEQSVSQQLGNAVASGLHLSHVLGDRVYTTLLTHKATLQDANNDSNLIFALEDACIPQLMYALRESHCSGAFVVFDITVNTHLAKAKHSRSGVYLKHANTTNTHSIDSPIFWLRGMPQIAEKYNFECHNKWDLEFDVSNVPAYAALLKTVKEGTEEAYYFTPTRYLSGTWEKVLLICIPLRNEEGKVYGICGLEISAILFKLAHAHIATALPEISGMLAIRQENVEGKHIINTGLGFQNGPVLNTPEHNHIFKIEKNDAYNIYTDGYYELVGRERALRLTPLYLSNSNNRWIVLASLPEAGQKAFLIQHYLIVGSFLVLILGVMIITCILVAQRYAHFILQGMHADPDEDEYTSNIHEIDAFLRAIKTQEQELTRQYEEKVRKQKDLAAQAGQIDMSAYKQFISQIETLSKAERLVFDLYVAGLSAQDIAKKLNLSINTIRTHNRNIYGKLNVSSYKEMMVYIQMMAGKAAEDEK